MNDLKEKGYHVILEEGATRAFGMFELYMLLPEPGQRRKIIMERGE